jgi:hypothetical protein
MGMSNLEDEGGIGAKNNINFFYWFLLTFPLPTFPFFPVSLDYSIRKYEVLD